uniref:Uncharacterized protein n=1 Tax=Amphimedon queenslandica TaxID=400682 RepID=A0A1X7UB56_AMPQE
MRLPNKLVIKSSFVVVGVVKAIKIKMVFSSAAAMAFVKNTIHHMKPIKGLCLGFLITWYLIYKIPITEEAKAKSKYLHPDLGDKH